MPFGSLQTQKTRNPRKISRLGPPVSGPGKGTTHGNRDSGKTGLSPGPRAVRRACERATGRVQQPLKTTWPTRATVRVGVDSGYPRHTKVVGRISWTQLDALVHSELPEFEATWKQLTEFYRSTRSLGRVGKFVSACPLSRCHRGTGRHPRSCRKRYPGQNRT